MENKLPDICLCSIVKNEEKIIKRMIDSVRSFIGYWIIVDTGSSDKTMNIIKKELKDIPGELHQIPWENFSKNRNDTLRLAKGKARYSLILDADEVLKIKQGFDASTMKDDCYNIKMYYHGLNYDTIRFVRTDQPWEYKGVIHNYLSLPNLKKVGHLKDVIVIHYHDGIRATDPNKTKNDRDILLKALEKEPNNSRYTYYLGQTYKELGDIENSIKYYTKRIEMGGWQEEIFYAKYEIAKLLERDKRPWPEVQQAYLDAYQYRPWRMEPLVHICRHYRILKQYHLGYLFGRQALEIPYPKKDTLFIEENYYNFILYDELAICAYWIKRYNESLALCNKLIEEKRLPINYIARVMKNRLHATRAMKLKLKLKYDKKTKYIYYHNDISLFGDNYVKNYKFIRIPLMDATEINKVFWFGIYDHYDANALLLSQGKIFLHWCGNDVPWTIQQGYAQAIANKNNIWHTCENELSKQELASVGIKAEIAPMFSEPKSKYKFKKPAEGEFRIVVYTPRRSELYNIPMMIEIAKELSQDVSQDLGQIKFDFIGDKQNLYNNLPKNVINHHFVSQDKVKQILANATIYLRITQHDAFPDMTIKAMLMGKIVITNYAYPFVCYADNKKDIINAIKGFYNQFKNNSLDLKEFTMKQIQYYKSNQFINNWDKIIPNKFEVDIRTKQEIPEDTHFIIWSSGFNGAKYIKKHMDSINNQTYNNYTAIIVDDASTDNSWEEIKKYKTDKYLIYHNENNIRKAANMIKYLKPKVEDEDVIIYFDLDDWFAHRDVLKRLNEIYTKEKCWTTYGHYTRTDPENNSPMQGYPIEIMKNKSFREYPWLWHHLRTFKGFLFHAIKENDFKGPDGKFIQAKADVALGFPILEMTPNEKIRYVPEILMVYNWDNPLNVWKAHKEYTTSLPEYIRAKPKYKLLKLEE